MGDAGGRTCRSREKKRSVDGGRDEDRSLTCSTKMIASTTAPSSLRAAVPRAAPPAGRRVACAAAGKQLVGPRIIKGPVFVTRDVR